MSLMSSAHSAWRTADVRVAEAVRAQARGRLAEATELLADALKIDNQNSQALHLLGNIRRRQQKADDARALLLAAHAERPRDARILNDLGLANQALGRVAEALNNFENALACDPQAVGAALNRSNALAKLNRTEEAIAGFKTLAEEHDDRVDVVANLSAVLEADGQFKAAAATVKEGLKLDSKHTQLSLAAARLERRFNRLKTARKRLSSLLKRERGGPSEAVVQNELALIFNASGDYAKAAEAFERTNQLTRRRIRGQFTRTAARQELSDGIRDAIAADLAPRPSNTKPTLPSPRFVMGAPGAGTVDIARRLRKYTDATVLLETSPISAMEYLWQRGRPLNDQELALMRQHYWAIADQLSADRKQSRYVDVATGNITRIHRILALFPDARFVMLVRHPADLALACWTQMYAPSSLASLSLEMRDCVWLAEQATAFGRRLARSLGDALRLVRYEEFAADPSVVTSAVLDHLHLPAKPEIQAREADFREGLKPGSWLNYWPNLKDFRSQLLSVCEQAGYPFTPPVDHA